MKKTRKKKTRKPKAPPSVFTKPVSAPYTLPMGTASFDSTVTRAVAPDPWVLLQDRETERLRIAAEVAADLKALKADSAWTRVLKYLGLA